MFNLLHRPQLPRRLMAVARLLDRQLAMSGRIRAVINDPRGELHRLIPLYETWLQRHINHRGGAVICTRRPIPVAFFCHGSRNITCHPFRNHIPAGAEPSPWHAVPRIAAAPALRSAARIGSLRCVSSVHILDAHRTGRLVLAMRALTALLPSGSGALVIAGNATGSPRSPFARLWRRLLTAPAPHYLLIDLTDLPEPEAPAARTRKPPKKTLFPIRSSRPRLPFAITLPRISDPVPLP